MDTLDPGGEKEMGREMHAGIRAAAGYLGFACTGKRIEAAFKSAVTGLIRQGELERDGEEIRRV